MEVSSEVRIRQRIPLNGPSQSDSIKRQFLLSISLEAIRSFMILLTEHDNISKCW